MVFGGGGGAYLLWADVGYELDESSVFHDRPVCPNYGAIWRIKGKQGLWLAGYGGVMTAHLTHWGVFEAGSDGERLTSVRPWRGDPEPMALIDNVASAQHHRTRIDQPYVRRGWLEQGPGPARRGDEPFVPVSWETAVGLLSGELSRVYREYGAESVYGGSYGWASAGRFHHAQSQVHRFLNCLGGYVRHVNSYSLGASSVLLPHVIADMSVLEGQATAKSVLAEHTDLVVAFGGLSPKNSAVSPGECHVTTRGCGSVRRGRGAAGSCRSARCVTISRPQRRPSGSRRGGQRCGADGGVGAGVGCGGVGGPGFPRPVHRRL